MRSLPSDIKDRDALLDIRDNVVLARHFVEDLSFEAFTLSRLHVYGTIRALEIVSEAARRLSPALQARHPDLPWRSIRDAGNVYRHAYDHVQETAVWRTVHVDLPPLLAMADAELALHL